MAERLHHILYAGQFSREFLVSELFPLATDMEVVARKRGSDLLKNRTMINLFYEPSTRTDLSFRQAARLLGIQIDAIQNAADFSSAAKGETIEDTTRILNGYGYDAIVIRSKEEDVPARAERASKRAAIINAGAGKGEHPTQAALDVYTIWKKFGRIDGLRVVMAGDLRNGRTVHSLAYLVTKFNNVSFGFVSPEDFAIPDELRHFLEDKKIPFTESRTLQKAVSEADVVYMTRVQKERSEGMVFNASDGDFIFDKEKLLHLPRHAVVMHPLPRNEELPTCVDYDERVIPFQQAENGLYVRMALLTHLLS